MKTGILKYALLLPAVAVLLPLASCKEQILNKFEEAPSVHFYRGASSNRGAIQRDSTNYSFFLAGSRTVDTVWLDVRLTGQLSSNDRPVTIVQTNEGENGAAVSGRDYRAFDSEIMIRRMVMPAGRVSAEIPIIVLRTEAMNTEEFRLDLAIVPNDLFVAGFVGRQTFTIKITARASQPAMWENISSNGYFQTFGAWGQEKMRFIIDHTGYTAFDETLTGTTYTDIRRFLNMKVRSAMAEYLLENDPLEEADGTTVEFPLI